MVRQNALVSTARVCVMWCLSTRIVLVALLLIPLYGCASTFAKSYVDISTIELELDLGKPVNIVELPDGKRSYQYYWGGGTYALPEYSTSTVTTFGNSAYVNTTTYPAEVVSSKGCLINFITEQREGLWIVVDATWPDRLVC